MNKNGFTLIELVVVIVIVGILAVVAAPKFMNTQSEARIATLKAAKSIIEGANNVVYGKAAMLGREFGANVVESIVINNWS